MSEANLPKVPINHFSPQLIFAQNLHGAQSAQSPASGFPSTAGKFGGMGGNIDKDSGLPFSQEGIQLGTEGLDAIVSYGSAYDQNPFELMFDGALSPFGLTKSECFSIKSLGILTALNNLSLTKQFKASLGANVSLSSKGAEQQA